MALPRTCAARQLAKRRKQAVLAALALGAIAAGPAPAQTLDLVGDLTPPLERGQATVSGVQSPLYRTTAVSDGRFVFRSLPPGGYTLAVMDANGEVARQTVQVTASLADERGQVRVELDLDRTASGARGARNTVSLAELRVAPKAKAAMRKAHARFDRGDQEGAIALLHKAVEISPTFTQAWNKLGTVAYKAGRYNEAERYFRTALEHDPLAFEPLVNLGGALLSQDRFDEALNFNLAAQSRRPGDGLANSQLGINFFYKGQLDKAREFLLRAKQADPSHFSYPQMFLADIYANQGKLAEARGELNETLRLHPDAPVADVARTALRQLDDAAARSGAGAP